MGYFRRLKKKHVRLETCKRRCEFYLHDLAGETDVDEIEYLANQWAIHRELQARHEGNNASETY